MNARLSNLVADREVVWTFAVGSVGVLSHSAWAFASAGTSALALGFSLLLIEILIYGSDELVLAAEES